MTVDGQVIYTPAEVGARLGIKKTSVQVYGSLHSLGIMIGHARLYRESDVTWIAGRRRPRPKK